MDVTRFQSKQLWNFVSKWPENKSGRLRAFIIVMMTLKDAIEAFSAPQRTSVANLMLVRTCRPGSVLM